MNSSQWTHAINESRRLSPKQRKLLKCCLAAEGQALGVNRHGIPYPAQQYYKLSEVLASHGVTTDKAKTPYKPDHIRQHIATCLAIVWSECEERSFGKMTDREFREKVKECRPHFYDALRKRKKHKREDDDDPPAAVVMSPNDVPPAPRSYWNEFNDGSQSWETDQD